MTYNLYIDVIFLVNFMMDLILMMILRIVLRFPKRPVRMIVSCLVGALYALLITMFPLLPLWAEAIITYGLISTLMLKIAFPLKGLRQTLKALLALLSTAFTMAGLGFFLKQNLMSGQSSQAAMPVSIWILLMAAGYFGIKYIWLFFQEEKQKGEQLYRVILCHRGKTLEVTGLLDTGNQLFEPVSKRPVHVITYRALEGFCQSVSGVTMIPYQAVGTKSGLLPAIQIEEMEIMQGEYDRHIKNVLIAVSKEALSPKHSYQMLLHRNILEE